MIRSNRFGWNLHLFIQRVTYVKILRLRKIFLVLKNLVNIATEEGQIFLFYFVTKYSVANSVQQLWLISMQLTIPVLMAN